MTHDALLVGLCRIYRKLLFAYPLDFRHRYGAEMTQLFRERCRSVLKESGLRGLPPFVMHVGVDWLTTVITERTSAVQLPAQLAGSNHGVVPGAPIFYVTGSEAPRFAAALEGMTFSIIIFSALFLMFGRRSEIFQSSSTYLDSAPSQAQASIQGRSSSSRLGVQPFWDQSSNLIGSNVIRDLLSQFDKYDVVALGEWHGRQEDQNLRLELIGDADFPKKVRNIVVECGNSLYQSSLDRYIKGERVPDTELRRVWRDTTQSPVMGSDDGSNACTQIFSKVRSMNQQLPQTQKIRVIAGDPPIDWERITTTEQFFTYLTRRDEVPAALIGEDVLRKREKALVIYGAGHIWRGNTFVKAPNLVSLLEKTYPRRICAVFRIGGAYPETEKLESLISNPARPILIPLRGTAIGALDANEFIGRDIPVHLFPDHFRLSQVADAIVYSGRRADTMIKEPTTVQIDPSFAGELARRKSLMPAPRQR